MSPSHDLDRFVEAQADVWAQAMQEVREGRKRTHWMWFIYPQLRGLGRSATAQHYGLVDLAEARDYAKHEVLGPRLAQAIEAVLQGPERQMVSLFGPVDALKFLSCLTLFEHLPPLSVSCKSAVEAFYQGKRDRLTLELLNRVEGDG